METNSRVRPGSEPIVRQFDETDPPTIVVDFGAAADDIRTDLVDDTLIVVDDATGAQRELALPGAPRRTFMQNGVLTIEVDA